MKKYGKILLTILLLMTAGTVYAKELPASITVATSGGTFVYPGGTTPTNYMSNGNLKYVTTAGATTYKTTKIDGKTVNIFCLQHAKTNPAVGMTMKKSSTYPYLGLATIIDEKTTWSNYANYNVYQKYYIRQMAVFWYLDKKAGVADNVTGQCSGNFKAATGNNYNKAAKELLNAGLKADQNAGAAAGYTFTVEPGELTFTKEGSYYVSNQITVKLSAESSSYGLYPQPQGIAQVIDRNVSGDRKLITFKIRVPESAIQGNSYSVSVDIKYAGVKAGLTKVFRYVVPNSNTYQTVVLAQTGDDSISKTIKGTIGKYKCPYTPEVNLTDDCTQSTSGYVKDIEDWDCIYASKDSGVDYFYDASKSNRYCETFCRETVEYYFPGNSFTVNGGTMFTIGERYDNTYALEPFVVANEKECRTKEIKTQQFLNDYDYYNNQMIDYWTKYKTEELEKPAHDALKNEITGVAWSSSSYSNTCGDTYLGSCESTTTDAKGKTTTKTYPCYLCSGNRTVTYISKSRSKSRYYTGKDGRTYTITVNQSASQVDCSGSGCGAYTQPHTEGPLVWSDNDTNCGSNQGEDGVLNTKACVDKFNISATAKASTVVDITSCNNISGITSELDPKVYIEFQNNNGYDSSYYKNYSMSVSSSQETESVHTCYDKDKNEVACKKDKITFTNCNGRLSYDSCVTNTITYDSNYNTGQYKTFEYKFKVDTVPYQYTCKDGVTRTQSQLTADLNGKCVSSDKLGNNLNPTEPYYFVPVPYSAPASRNIDDYSYTVKFGKTAFGVKQKFYSLLTGDNSGVMEDLTKNARVETTGTKVKKYSGSFYANVTYQSQYVPAYQYWGSYATPSLINVNGSSYIYMNSGFQSSVGSSLYNEILNSDCARQYGCTEGTVSTGYYWWNMSSTRVMYCTNANYYEGIRSYNDLMGNRYYTDRDSYLVNWANAKYQQLYQCLTKDAEQEDYSTESDTLGNYVCSYQVNEYVEPIYRTISLTDPFPGINGTTRKSGSNWSQEDIKNKIKFNRGVETGNVYKQKPIYEFTLTPSNIMRIRNYNTSHEYSDFELRCQADGKNCISTSFFKNGESQGLYSSPGGTCYNVSSNNFNKCLEVK